LGNGGLRLMDRPQRGEALGTGWLAYSVAVSTGTTGMPDRSELELRVDGEPYTLMVSDGRYQARRGTAAHPIAIIDAPPRVLFRLATGRAARGDLERDGQISIENNSRTAPPFLHPPA